MASVVMGMKYPVVALMGQVTSQVEHEANCSLMITTTQVKLKTLYPGTSVTSDKNILYARRLVVYRNQRRWWCKKQGNKDCD